MYFTFLFLPFGLSSAVHCITKLFKPINAYIHNKGVRRSIYLDDEKITSDTYIFGVMILCKKLSLRIIPIHLLRDDQRIKLEDGGSKTTDPDYWQIYDETF